MVSVKSSESKREKSAELKVPSKRKSVNSSHSSSKKLMENSNVSKDMNSIENQENEAHCVNSKDDNADATGNVSETGTKESECCQTNTSKYLLLPIC